MKRIPLLLFSGLLLALGVSCSDSAPKANGEIYIAIVSKGFQHQFWQTVYSGSKAAAEDLGVKITFEGPPSETNIDTQIEMVTAALNKKPNALCLAIIDVSRLNDKLLAAKAAKIPVIGFDSGIPNAPAGVVASTACTDNYAAGELAAIKMFEEATIKERLASATADSPIIIGVLSQDVISVSIVERTRGFIDKFRELANEVHQNAVAISGHATFAQPATGETIVDLLIAIPTSTEYSDTQIAAQKLLAEDTNLIGIFCSNEGTVTGLLSATNEGKDLDRTNGIYKDITVIGFDAGISQKQAVRKQYFYGSITQDPYRIGYLAVELAYKAIKGESIESVVDTGCKFYSHENIDNPDIAPLVYD